MKKWAVYLLVVTSALFAKQPENGLPDTPSGWYHAWSLPQIEIDSHFAEVSDAVERRWDLLTAEIFFPLFEMGKEKSVVDEEFNLFDTIRFQLWLGDDTKNPCVSNPLFKVSQKHLQSGTYRQPNCVTFEHSATDPCYNSSTVLIGGRRFFAMEGPKKEHVNNFFHLLSNWRVAALVCLTDSQDARGFPKCYPYWEDRIEKEGDHTFLHIPLVGQYADEESWETMKIPYLFWPDWEDNAGIDPNALLHQVNPMRLAIPKDSIMAVHCSAGVGRTGTFIAAIALLDAIDEQLERGIDPSTVELSVAKIFLYLNFFRPWMVARTSQYETLYRLTQCYLENRSSQF